MKKYISPSYEEIKLETEDIMNQSSLFTEETSEEKNKIDYIISPESIFGF